jgi:hypothetical protein
MMKNKIKKMLKLNCMNSFISIIALTIFFYGQSYAQWERTNLPDSVKVNTMVIKDSSVFAGTNGDGIFVSTNNGENWDNINEGLQNKFVHTILINGKTIFAGTDSGASISTDNGANWSTIDSGLSGLGVWSLAVNTGVPGDTTIFAGTWSGVYSSTDNGKNWKVTGLSSTITPVHSVIIYKNYIFAATFFDGLFQSQDNGLTWKDISFKYINSNTGAEIIDPIPTLIKFVNLNVTYIAASALSGYFYYWDDNSSSFTTSIKSGSPIYCFAGRNDTLYAGTSKGYFYRSNIIDKSWVLANFPFLGNQAIYSLALNDSYAFAGTVNGIWRLWYPETITNIDNTKEAPAGFTLEQNYPNPFNPVTTIKYSIPTSKNPLQGGARGGLVTLKVYNLLGSEVATLVNEQQTPGNYEVKFDGSKLASGMYIYRLQAGSFVAVKKLMLLK